jgi:hypothetical protein
MALISSKASSDRHYSRVTPQVCPTEKLFVMHELTIKISIGKYIPKFSHPDPGAYFSLFFTVVERYRFT